MSLSLDATTLAEYTAELPSPSAAAQAVVDAVVDQVSVKVYDGSATLKPSGTMGTPWATQSAGVITVAEMSGFQISGAGSPDPATWYLRFESGTPWLRGSFGAAGQALVGTDHPDPLVCVHL